MNSNFSKLISAILATMMTIIGWFIKVEITEVSETLKTIRVDVSALNRESLLLKQRVDFKIEFMEGEIRELKEQLKNR